TQVTLVLPTLLSLAYVLPLLTSSRRLRDLHFIKIFLVATIWASVTVLLPALEMGKLMLSSNKIFLIFLERAFFIFAITLPFDIRDLKIDAHTAVKTIPSEIGVKRTKQLAYLALCLAFITAYFNFQLYTYTLSGWLAIGISIFSTGIFVRYSEFAKHDYYFTGILDGTMIIQLLLLGLLQ
ncbi:MAG: hypothetical protein AAF738_06695, partial [Bacteroidota bacterium]